MPGGEGGPGASQGTPGSEQEADLGVGWGAGLHKSGKFLFIVHLECLLYF